MSTYFIGDTQRTYDETEAFVRHANGRDDIDFVIHGGNYTEFGMTKERATAKPIIIQFIIGEGIQQAIRIIDVRRRPSEVVAVILSAQSLNHLFPGISQLLSHIINIARHLRQHLPLGNATDGCIRLIHTDILDIVQLAEDTELRELGNTRQEDEAQVGIASLQRRIEIAHRVAQSLQLPFLMYHVEQRIYQPYLPTQKSLHFLAHYRQKNTA